MSIFQALRRHLYFSIDAIDIINYFCRNLCFHGDRRFLVVQPESIRAGGPAFSQSAWMRFCRHVCEYRLGFRSSLRITCFSSSGGAPERRESRDVRVVSRLNEKVPMGIPAGSPGGGDGIRTRSNCDKLEQTRTRRKKWTKPCELRGMIEV